MTRKIFAPLMGAAAVALLLAGCADMGGYGHRNYAAMSIDYDGYYDNYYGPINDGYWGSDGVFWYSNARGHGYQRDDAHHVRRDSATGFSTLHGHHDGATGGDRHDH